MQPRDFALERYFARYEFSTPYLLCCSDCESMSIKELLDLKEGSQEEFLQTRLGYTESQGSPLLRQEIAMLYNHIALDQVLVHTGAEEAIHNFMASQLQPGDHVIVQTPCYQSLIELPRVCACQVSSWPLHPVRGQWKADIEELKRMITPRTRFIIINSPHNPTGHLFSAADWQDIMNTAARQEIIVFADEVYKYLEYDQEPLSWACDIYDNAVSMGVMSKSFGLPGLRIGWIATRNADIFKRMAAYKDYTTICNSAPSEYLAAVALQKRSVILERSRNLIKANLDLLEEFFSRHQDRFDWLKPQAGPIAFPALKGGLQSTDYARHLAEQSGILLLPGSCYDFDDRHFRIGFGRADFTKVLSKWDDYLSHK